MRYKFIRTGKDETSQVASEDTIRDCFLYCSESDKRKLEEFFKSRRSSETFHYSGYTVIIERYRAN